MGRFGRAIDAAMLGLAAYAAAFLYFLWATGSAWAGALLAAVPCALAVWAYRRVSAHRIGRRERARRAQAAVEQLALLPEGEARERATEYAGFAGVLLQRHPKGAPLDANEVLALWRATSGETLDIATTGSASDAAHALAESLLAPKVRLYDGRALAEQFAKSSLPLPEPPVVKRRFSLRVPRKRARYCAGYGLAMLGMYVVTGLWAYLAASLVLLALTMLALKRPVAAG